MTSHTSMMTIKTTKMEEIVSVTTAEVHIIFLKRRRVGTKKGTRTSRKDGT